MISLPSFFDATHWSQWHCIYRRKNIFKYSFLTNCIPCKNREDLCFSSLLFYCGFIWVPTQKWSATCIFSFSVLSFFLFNQRKKDGTHPVYGLVTPRPSVPVYRPQPPVLIGQFVWQPSPLVWMVHGMANSLPWQLLDTILGDSPCYVRLRGRKKNLSSVFVCDVVVLSIYWMLTNQF